MDWWRGPLRDLVGGRRVIVTGGVAAAWTPVVEPLRQAGATDVLVVAEAPEGRLDELEHAEGVTVERRSWKSASRLREVCHGGWRRPHPGQVAGSDGSSKIH